MWWEPVAKDPGPVEVLDERERCEELRRAIQRLRYPERLLLSAVYLEGVPVRTLATLLNVSSSAIYKRLERALERARAVLAPPGLLTPP